MSSVVRHAQESELDLLAGIEADADRLFLERFRPEAWGAAPSGRARAEQPGFLLVAVEDGEVVGFAHVLERGGTERGGTERAGTERAGAHLEQLAVRRDAGRRGHGSALVRGVLAEAARRGHRAVTLETYADVPWNAPFYASLGFVESGSAPEPDLERYGRRVRMTASTSVSGPR